MFCILVEGFGAIHTSENLQASKNEFEKVKKHSQEEDHKYQGKLIKLVNGFDYIRIYDPVKNDDRNYM